MTTFLQISGGIIGIALLYYGAEYLIKGGVSVALKLKVSPLLIGLTLVAMGTSAPELVVSIDAALHGSGDISIGNVVGSNICNIALILGLCALIAPMPVNPQLLKLDTPLMLGVSILFAAFYIFSDGIMRYQAAILLAILLIYTIGSFYASRKNNQDNSDDADSERKVFSYPVSFIMLIAGFAGLIAGAKLFVNSAVHIATLCNISQATIGLTIVALGTSLPELATSVVAAIKKEQDIAIGNVVGSNIFNILCILGIAPLIKPIHAPGLNLTDMAVMLLAAGLLYLFMLLGKTINRKEGFILLLCYIGYTAWLFCK